jgi:hypothetical protein
MKVSIFAKFGKIGFDESLHFINMVNVGSDESLHFHEKGGGKFFISRKFFCKKVIFFQKLHFINYIQIIVNIENINYCL